MLNKFKKQMKNEKGLTLIELLAVIVILAIVAAIAVPAIGNIITNSKYNAVKADALNVISAAQLYYTDDVGAADGVTVTLLKTGGYLDDAGKIPETATVSKGTPQAITAAAITYATGHTVAFSSAASKTINVDNTKPKGNPTITISGTGVTGTN